MSLIVQTVAVHYKRSKIGAEVIAHRSENSVLDHPEGLIPYSVGGRKRLATCSGVHWIDDHHLVTVNLYGQNLRIYRLDESKKDEGKKYELKLLFHKIDEIIYPDAVAVSPDGKWIAVTHSLLDEKGVTVHPMNSSFEVLNMVTSLTAPVTCHGVHFSPDSRYLAFTTLEYPGSVEVYSVNNPGHRVCFIPNDHAHLRPKDVCFTSDAKYVAIIYSEIVGIEYQEHTITDRRLAIHKYDASKGIIEENSIAVLHDNNFLVNSFELSSFRPGVSSEGYQLFVTNQFADKVVQINFNPSTDSINITDSYGGKLSFPHGMDISPDGEWIAVSNFGDDHVRIFELKPEIKQSENHLPHILLCAHSSYRQLFGAERSFIDLAKTFHQLGYPISCLLPHENMEYTNELANYVDAVYHLEYTWHDHNQPYNDRYVAEIESLIKREKIDIIHSNSTVIPDVLIAARRVGKPAVLHARELLTEDVVLTSGIGANTDLILSNLSKAADFIIANSRKTMEQFQGVKNKYCLYNAIEIDRFDIGPISKSGTLKIGLISSNIPKKGIYDFADLAIAALPDTQLEFILIGPINNEIEKIQVQLKDRDILPSLRFIDYVSDPVEAISKIDVVVNLSQVGESFGRTIAEGMAARRPVIAYDKGAMAELITHKLNGFLVEPGDLNRVAYWLKWLNENREKAIEMGECGRQYVYQTFSFDLFKSNLDNIYKTIKGNI